MSRKKGGGGGGGHDGAGGLRWLLTYADMITLVMAFFIMLFALSAGVDEGRFDEAAAAIRAGFGQAKPVHRKPLLHGAGTKEFPPKFRVVDKDFDDDQITGASSAIQMERRSCPSCPPPTKQSLEELKDRIQTQMDKKGVDSKVTMKVAGNVLVVNIPSDNVLFDSGKADLRPGAQPILNSIATGLRGFPYEVRVEGHTDSIPIHNEQFPSNWELSTARATSVVRYWLATGQLKDSLLSAGGYSDSKPVASNASTKGRSLNRRVEVTVLWRN